ncbi:MAG: hypothetical protein OXF74_01925 [Rhodobacteraceae bacterium]|nr:hypothetical protein [Paracoccaceae bacterium]
MPPQRWQTFMRPIDVRVHSLVLGGVDLISTTGKFTMHVVDAVMEF